MCKRPGFYHSTSKTHLRDRIFKLSQFMLQWFITLWIHWIQWKLCSILEKLHWIVFVLNILVQKVYSDDLTALLSLSGCNLLWYVWVKCTWPYIAWQEATLFDTPTPFLQFPYLYRMVSVMRWNEKQCMWIGNVLSLTCVISCNSEGRSWQDLNPKFSMSWKSHRNLSLNQQ